MKGKIFFSAVVILLALILVTTDSCAQKTENIVSVDFAQPVSGTKSMSGFLHSFDEEKPPENLIFPLKPKLWRLSSANPAVYPRIRKSGAKIQLVLSDFWGYTGLNTDRPAPFQDFSQFENFVRSLAKTYNSKDIIWDIWNEPEDLRLPFWKGTFRQFCETYLRAYKILRQELGPEVAIGGPSFSRYDKTLLKQFLDFCKANGCEVNFLSWHELNDTKITGIEERLNEARDLFVKNPDYANLKIKEILINEIVGSHAQNNPGAIIGYFYYLEKGKADGAAKACWENLSGSYNCYNNTLDGLLREEDLQPTAAWWAYKIYADGAESRVASATTNPLVAVLSSTQSDTPGAAQIIIGYFTESFFAPQKINLSLALKNLSALSFLRESKAANIKIQKIQNTREQAIQTPALVLQENFGIVNNSLNLSLNDVSSGDAYLIRLTKSAREKKTE